MNVLTVGLLCIAAYAVVVMIWLRHDKNKSEYVGRAEGGRR